VLSHLLPTYARADLAFERGEGAWLTATTGERYLDFSSGVAVNVLGHAHPKLVEALTDQAQKLWHVSNLYRIPEAEKLAQRLCAASFADVVFFCNSGAEAMEGAIKMARKYQAVSGHPSAIASSPSRAPFTAAPWARSQPPAPPNISKALARRWTASTRCRTAISKR
jgi:acetylornithine/N-succinyldiaminopimelate aminotransferase